MLGRSLPLFLWANVGFCNTEGLCGQSDDASGSQCCHYCLSLTRRCSPQQHAPGRWSAAQQELQMACLMRRADYDELAQPGRTTARRRVLLNAMPSGRWCL